MKRIKDLDPTVSSKDDAIAARFVAKTLRMYMKQGKTVHDWWSRLPENLQRDLYLAKAFRIASEH